MSMQLPRRNASTACRNVPVDMGPGKPPCEFRIRMSHLRVGTQVL
jgi:hypothetical protein